MRLFEIIDDDEEIANLLRDENSQFAHRWYRQMKAETHNFSQFPDRFMTRDEISECKFTTNQLIERMQVSFATNDQPMRLLRYLSDYFSSY